MIQHLALKTEGENPNLLYRAAPCQTSRAVCCQSQGTQQKDKETGWQDLAWCGPYPGQASQAAAPPRRCVWMKARDWHWQMIHTTLVSLPVASPLPVAHPKANPGSGTAALLHPQPPLAFQTWALMAVNGLGLHPWARGGPSSSDGMGGTAPWQGALMTAAGVSVPPELCPRAVPAATSHRACCRGWDRCLLPSPGLRGCSSLLEIP